ncbi:alpha/beta hydrolase [Aeromicrobium sp.]|uniref:alpha/beta fold hydrolase n=1 Tax=Aeromicrobium sp. TaxID=1871063 RepID=UPI0019CB023D|nr:alpha/beta hydrolase [Aeromicrobium sp.]MBC7629913.1 alpha/beta hydrolase [Aeromicrobium sp.]
MTEHTTSTVTSDDGTALATYTWAAPEPRGVIQIAHGLGEHALRYAATAADLNADGWTVVAHDHRGHGATATPETYGQIGADGWGRLVADIGLVGTWARTQADGPLVLLGHSMGSFAVQQYLLDHSDDVDGVILTGTGAIDMLEPALDLDAEIDLTMFNAAFQPQRTDFDWLSRDEAQVDAYVADDRCGFGLDKEAGKAMFAGSHGVADPARMSAIRDDLPMHICVGEADPVNGELALVHPLVQRYHAAGLTDVTLVTYPEARHEILNETNRDDVIAEIVTWLDEHFGRL